MNEHWQIADKDIEGAAYLVRPVSAESGGRQVLGVRFYGADFFSGLYRFLEANQVRQLRDACNRFLAETGEEK